MSKQYSLKNALEDFQEDLTDIEQSPPVSSDDAAISEDAIGDDLQDSRDLGDDVSTLSAASESLESLAIALEMDMFQNHAASAAEVNAVKFALESFGLEDDAEPVKQGDTKKSLKDKVVEGAKKLWKWLMDIGTKIAEWVSGVYARMFKPVTTYESRMAEVVKKSSEKLNEVNGDKYAKQLASEKGVAVGLKDLANFVSDIADANSHVMVGTLLSEIEKNGQADGKAIVEMLNKMQSRFLPAYPVERDGKYYSRRMIGGHTFMMSIGGEEKIDWDHKHEQVKSDKGPKSLSASELKSLSDAISDGVSVWKAAQASVSRMKISKVADDIKRIGKTYKGELNSQAKDALRVMPKMLKSPVVDASLAIASVMGAAVSFAEAHVSTSAKEMATSAGNSVKNAASSRFTASGRALSKANAATTAAANAAKNAPPPPAAPAAPAAKAGKAGKAKKR